MLSYAGQSHERYFSLPIRVTLFYLLHTNGNTTHGLIKPELHFTQ